MAQMYEAKKLMQTIRKMYELPTEYRVQVMATISRMGAVEAVEVVHGRCKKSDDQEEWYTYYYTCLECGATMMVADADYRNVSPNYCPCCGAKMDK